MNLTKILASAAVSCVAVVAGVLVLSPGGTEAQGLAGTPEQQAAQAKLEAGYPKLQVTDQYMQLSIPGYTMGQTVGVATNSKGHLFVYSRTLNQGVARGGKAAILWEFDANGKFVKEWGPNNYAEAFAHAVRVDKSDNVWQVDEGSNMIIKYNPEGQHVMWLGRTPEAIDYLERNLEYLHFASPNPPTRDIHPKGRVGTFDRETDIAFDTSGNLFVSDGYGNSRVVKISPDGHWLKELGTWGHDQDQFVTPHGIASDGHNVYVADRGNRRIQVYDDDLNYKSTITGIGAPWSLCVTNTTPQYLFTGDGTTGKVFKLDLTGKVLGMFVTGQDHGAENVGDLIHALDCRSDKTIYIGSASMWDVQKVTIGTPQRSTAQ